MTRNYYKTGNYKTGHSTFSGEIQIEDFNTYSPNKKRISNQIEAINFSETIQPLSDYLFSFCLVNKY